jgi:hypothetical protein
MVIDVYLNVRQFINVNEHENRNKYLLYKRRYMKKIKTNLFNKIAYKILFLG